MRLVSFDEKSDVTKKLWENNWNCRYFYRCSNWGRGGSITNYQFYIFFIIKPTRCTNFKKNYFVMKLYMFRTVHLSIIRSLFTVHSAVVYVIQVCRQLSSRTRMELKFHPGPTWKLWHIPWLRAQWINSCWWTQELSKTYRVSCQIKFVKLVYLVGFNINNF